MKKILLALCLAFTLVACHSDDETEPPVIYDETFFVYMPWTGNLTDYLQSNISAIKRSIVKRKGLGTKRVLVFFAKSTTQSALYEIKYSNGECKDDTLKRYTFNDTDYMQKNVDAWQLNNYLFKLASNLQSSELHKKITLYDIFTDDEIYSNWLIANARWYIEYGGCALNGSTQPYSQRHLLKRIIEQADSCIRLKKPGATLRFGHETMVMPLTCLLELNDYGLQESNLERLESKGWLNYRIFPMGANIQFIFYRKDFDDKDVLVKVLLNENEARLPLPDKTAPYYKWADVRAYYLDKIAAYEQNRR